MYIRYVILGNALTVAVCEETLCAYLLLLVTHWILSALEAALTLRTPRSVALRLAAALTLTLAAAAFGAALKTL